jgi:precorrin-2/cobalt-factor-2 C20-methyltransferase
MNEGAVMPGKFYVVGVGPGDPRLLTLRAAEVLRHCPVWLVPSAFAHGEHGGEGGSSMALKIAEGAVASDGKTIISHHFPMKPVPRRRPSGGGQAVAPEVMASWRWAAEAVLAHLAAGRDVAFPTLGDPAIYSTGFYLLETLRAAGDGIGIKVIPGVSAPSSASAAAVSPLCLGDERVVIIPAVFDDQGVRELLAICQVAVFMKVNKSVPRLITLLDEFGLTGHAVLVERASLPGQRLWTDIRQAATVRLHYFSTMIVRKPSEMNHGRAAEP